VPWPIEYQTMRDDEDLVNDSTTIRVRELTRVVEHERREKEPTDERWT
jgi:hypothetical protein